MSEAETLHDDYNKLNDLIVNSPEFEELERLLGGFNLFQVLKFEYGEIRHSNVLAWILDPSESHGLDESFLRKWLMRVIYESPDTRLTISAIDIDSWQLLEVEVRREWEHIDLLLILRFAKAAPWVICIENKVNSTQHSGQLSRYRTAVEEEFSDAGHRIYLFLTRHSETPDDSVFVPASYSQVHRVLKDCMAARAHLIGSGPKTLLENYVSLLEEKFMDQSKIAQIARTIYKQHRRALDVIFEHHPENLLTESEPTSAFLSDKAEELGIVVSACSKTIIRFIPKEWDQPGNKHGTGWLPFRHTVLFEINLATKGQATLSVVSGKAPSPWIDELWALSCRPESPFCQPKKHIERPVHWPKLHHAGTKEIRVDEDIPQQIFDWCRSLLKDSKTFDVINLISERLPNLEAHHKSIEA